MLTKFKIRNFRSIADLTLDFSFGEMRAPNRYLNKERMPFIEDGLARAVPCLALFGPNAAGKSNIVRGVRVFMELVRNRKSDVRRLYDPNRIVTGGTATRFEGEIVKDGVRYAYSLEYSDEGILSEQLTVAGKMLYAVDNGKCDFSELETSRPYDQKELARIHAVECCTADGVAVYPLFPVLGWGFGGLDARLSSAFRAFTGGVSVFFDDFGPQLLPMAIDTLSELTSQTKEEALRRVLDVVRKLDVDILSLDIIESLDVTGHGGEPLDPRRRPYDLVKHEDTSGKDFGISIYSHHRNDKGEDVVFRFLECESEGTKRLAVVVAVVLHALAVGGAVFFDEFDRGLHPLLVRELVSLFQKRAYNPKGAQLCFATHCTDILDDSVLRMSEVGIVTKNIKTGTMIRRLSDFKRDGEEVRNVTDFRKRYLDGFYAGIPYPAL